jgi:hypothetical protein
MRARAGLPPRQALPDGHEAEVFYPFAPEKLALGAEEVNFFANIHDRLANEFGASVSEPVSSETGRRPYVETHDGLRLVQALVEAGINPAVARANVHEQSEGRKSDLFGLPLNERLSVIAQRMGIESPMMDGFELPKDAGNIVSLHSREI